MRQISQQLTHMQPLCCHDGVFSEVQMEKNIRSMILRAAYNRFHEGGVKNTTITDITRDAFVQPSTIAYHFKDRSGLEESLMHCIDDSIMSYAESIADSSELILPVWIYLLWNNVLSDKGFRAMQEEIFFSDVNLERESVIFYVVSLLQNLYYTFTGKEMPPRGDNWILISNTLNTFMIKYDQRTV